MKPAEERELHLRVLAASAERRNRPRALPVAAAALLAAGVAYSGWAVAQAGARDRELNAAAESNAEVMGLVNKIKAIREDRGHKPVQDQFRRDDQLLGKLERIHEGLGVAQRPTLMEQPRPRPLGLDAQLQERVVTATLLQMSMTDAMRWINTALADIPGLHVIGIEIRPDRARGWVVSVDLGRWELKP